MPIGETGYIEVSTLIKGLNKSELAMLSFAQTVDEGRYPYSEPHCRRVAVLGVALGQKLGLSASEQFGLYCGGYLHDIGKIGIPDTILFRAGRLDADQFRVMQTHVVIGHDICRVIPAFSRSLSIVRHHHEKWDGVGYPDRLAGKEIPLLARIFAIVDTYDAFTTPRQYRAALSHDDTIGVMTEPRVFDVELVRAFAELPIAAHVHAMRDLPRLPFFRHLLEGDSEQNVANPIEFYSCFISYSSHDEDIARRINEDLRMNGIRSWYAPDDLKIGDRLRVQIGESIKIHDKLLLILSSTSVESTWVESEVEAALEEERHRIQGLPEAVRGNSTVLFPIRIDDSVFKIQSGWAADIRRNRHIGDFRDWRNNTSYDLAFKRLMRDLAASDIADNEAREARRIAVARLRTGRE